MQGREEESCRNQVNNAKMSTFDALQMKACRDLWDEFGKVPMDPETECIEEEWNGFPKGTRREEIWHWFDNNCPLGVAELMYEKED